MFYNVEMHKLKELVIPLVKEHDILRTEILRVNERRKDDFVGTFFCFHYSFSISLQSRVNGRTVSTYKACPAVSGDESTDSIIRMSIEA